MNVIISNKNKYLLENLGVDVIKDLNGEFEVDEIIATFQNFFYQRMILDITALKNYTDIRTLQKLSISLNMDKLILLLDGTDVTTNPIFLSNLVSMGIYNFARDVDGIQYLYNTPNTYRDVAQYHKLNTQESQVESQPQKQQRPNVFQNVIQNLQQVQSNNTLSEKTDVKSNFEKPFGSTKIIGVKNIAKQSGATSLVYMMMKQLDKNYDVLAIEVDKNDFNYFKDKRMLTSNSTDIDNVISKNRDKEVIIIDTNNSMSAEKLCTDILYLIEPSIIKINKMMALNSQVLYGLKGKKVILNQSLLTKDEVKDFAYEARINVYHNLGPLNERDKDIPELDELLVKLGFTRQQ